MRDYDIPGSASELFANGERSYHIIDPDQVGDNTFAMRLFVEQVGIPASMIETDDGTQVTLSDGNTRIVIDSGGLGDFDRHGYDVTLAKDQTQRSRAERIFYGLEKCVCEDNKPDPDCPLAGEH